MIETFLPMLAVRSAPFDSPEHLFELKWDGVRALAAVEQGRGRLWGRELTDYTARYPELACLGRLPSGTVLDGELVLLGRGRPELDALLARHHQGSPVRIRELSQSRPVTYVVFDLLFERGRSLFGQPLQARRELLRHLLGELEEPRLQISEGVVGAGRAVFEHAVLGGHEGMMAKHLASGYRPGRRSAAWRKIKPVREVPAAILGFVPGREGLHGLLVAAVREGRLRYVATLRSGFGAEARTQLHALLSRRVQPRPWLACPRRGVWVAAGLYCRVRYLEWTAGGRLRGASYRGLLEDSAEILRGVP